MPPLFHLLHTASTIQLFRSLSTSSASKKQRLTWLDLRGLGLSALERLCIEELLLRHDPLNRCWGIVGCHEPVDNRLLSIQLPSRSDCYEQGPLNGFDEYGHVHSERNKSCAIILGIGGKMDRLVNVPAARRDGVLVLRRFSGGGTVVVDHNSLWTTFIGRNDLPMSAEKECVKPFPREIMAWSAETIFGPTFNGWNADIALDRQKDGTRQRGRQTLVFKGKSCGINGGVGESLILPPNNEDDLQSAADNDAPLFQLRENDYVLGQRKMGGNAQSIVSSGFLHHTSFLWDYDHINMEYLTLPEKRPDYRGNRSHGDFLMKLKDSYGSDSTKNSFFDHVKKATEQTFELEEVSLLDILDIANHQYGSLQRWFDGKCRTKIEEL